MVHQPPRRRPSNRRLLVLLATTLVLCLLSTPAAAARPRPRRKAAAAHNNKKQQPSASASSYEPRRKALHKRYRREQQRKRASLLADRDLLEDTAVEAEVQKEAPGVQQEEAEEEAASPNSQNESFPAIAIPTPDYILNNGKGPLVVDDSPEHWAKLEAVANLPGGDDDEGGGGEEEGDDEGGEKPSTPTNPIKTTADGLLPEYHLPDVDGDGEEDDASGGIFAGRVPYSLSGIFSFFLIGGALVAIAYHLSRRSGTDAAAGGGLMGLTRRGGHNSQPQFDMASPRITFASATHTSGSRGKGPPPQFHLEPTYTSRAARGGQDASSFTPSSGRRGSTTNPLQLQHLNHHNLAKGPVSVSSSSSTSSAVTAAEGAAASRNMSIYREAPCSACGLQPRTHALVPCSHLVCEGCASTASFCATCKSAVVSKNWVLSPGQRS